jgi:hypothetical protein
MSKKNIIDQIQVEVPCKQDWKTMHGNDAIRFCDHCSKSVTDLSSMTRKRAIKLVLESAGRLCVRYVEDPNSRAPIFADHFVRLTRRASPIAASVLSASFAMSSAAYSQSPVAEPLPQQTVSKSVPAEKKPDPPKSAAVSELKGTVTDRTGAVVPGASVMVVNMESKAPFTGSTDLEGNYVFRDLPVGLYQVEVTHPGFVVHQTQNIELASGKEVKVDAVLQIGAVMGDVAIALPAFESPISQAIQGDDVEAVRDAIAKGARVNFKEKGNDDVTPLFVAVEHGNVEIVRLLLEQGAKVNARNAQRQTPLMRLDDDSTKELVELLLNHGAKIDLEDKMGNTALILAAESASAEVIEALLKGSPDVNVANEEGQTALMNAAYNDDLESVKLLINAGADVHMKNSDEESAIDMTSDEEVEKLLVAHGATPKEKIDDIDGDYEEPAVAEEPITI